MKDSQKQKFGKVLFVAPLPPPYAGPEVISAELLKALQAIKCPFEVIHLRSNIRKENLKKGILDLEGVLAFLGVYFKFLRHLIFSRITITYLLLSSGKVGFLRDAVLIFTASLFGKAVVAHYHGGNFHNFYNSSTPLYKKLIESTMNRVDTLIVLANNLKFMFEELVAPERIKVLYNGLRVEEYSSIERNPHKKNAVTILFMGHLTFTKGFNDLICAYKRLKNNYPDVRLVFAGGMPGINPEHKNLLQGTQRESFLNNIDEITNEALSFIENAASYDAEYIGFVSGEEKTRVFANADIFVFPSYTEGFPMAVLEAMASSLPVIATPVGALPEILEYGANGFFVEVGNIDDLVYKMEILIKDKVLRDKIGLFNKDYVSKRFGIKTVTENLIQIWKETLDASF